jgi:hypothetical protein
MKLFDKKAEKRVWLALLFSVPFVLFVLWVEYGKIELTEIIITAITFIIGIVVLYAVKSYANK